MSAPDADHADPPPDWPWDLKRHWKPTPGDPVRQLVKAGALIAAEIDRRLADGGEAAPRCRFTPETCMDDLCRGSAERGLCGNWRSDALPNEFGGDDDGYDDEYSPGFGFESEVA